MRRFIFLSTAIVSLFIASQRVRAVPPTPVSSCGTVSGSIILTQDISTTDNDCLVIGANNTTIDGNGKIITINDAGHAISALNKSGLTVSNLTSNSDIYINGDSADSALIENNTLGGVYIASADDVTIRNNFLSSLVVGQDGLEDTVRATVSGNTIRGTSNKLVAIRGSGILPCAPSNHVITNNTIISEHVCTSGLDCDEPMAMYIWCSAGSTYSNNSITSTAKAQGIRLRDESDSNTFTNNVVWVHDPDGDFGALNLTSGNADKHHPRLNTFTGNTFRSDNDLALNMQSPGDGNSFIRNIFWTNTSGGFANLMNDGANNNSWNHNTFYNAGSSAAAFFDYRNDRPTDSFTNNIFAAAGGMAMQVSGGIAWSFNRYAGDYNLFWSTNQNTVLQPYGPLATWKSSGSPDDAHSILGNPQFTNAAAGDFSLQNTSTARGAASDGTDIGAIQSAPTPGCTETWSCSAWSVCLNNTQSRSCTDLHACGTISARPPLTQGCTVSDPPPNAIDTTPPASISTLQAY